ncbi:ketoacyl-ACP synthase III [Prochlorococcus sp. AH-716-B04]|nr:ketoacyl-ACP synthase III [Prochlorococcus sp. AH-716-B04]
MSNSKKISSHRGEIVGIVGCIPKNTIENSFFEKYIDKNDIKAIEKSTGVLQRRWVKNKNKYTYDLCIAAAQDLIKNIKWKPDSIDCTILITQTHKNIMPAESHVIQNALGISKSSLAFDINLGCSGYAYGCMIANSLINSGLSRILVLAGETPSRIVDFKDKSSCILFGDAGTATAIEKNNNHNEYNFLFGSDGSGEEHLVCKNNSFLEMNGAEVFSFTLNTIPNLVTELDYEAKKKHDYYLFHQANSFILKNLIRKAKLDIFKCPSNISKYGNVSSASIPLLITSNLNPQIINQNKNISCLGFGVGLSWSAMSFNSKSIKYLNLLEEDL